MASFQVRRQRRVKRRKTRQIERGRDEDGGQPQGCGEKISEQNEYFYTIFIFYSFISCVSSGVAHVLAMMKVESAWDRDVRAERWGSQRLHLLLICYVCGVKLNF